MNKKLLLWIALIIASVIAIYELTWVHRSSLAGVIIALAVAVVLIGVYLLKKK